MEIYSSPNLIKQGTFFASLVRVVLKYAEIWPKNQGFHPLALHLLPHLLFKPSNLVGDAQTSEAPKIKMVFLSKYARLLAENL